MNHETFFENFGFLVDTPNGVEKLREIILQLAIHGKLVPQNPNDEPASVLLMKIRAEKAQSQLARQLRKLKPEKQLSDSGLEQVRNEADEAATQAREVQAQVTALETDLATVQDKLEEPSKKDAAKPKPASKVKQPRFTSVTDKQVQAAVFDNDSQRIIFTRARSDISVQRFNRILNDPRTGREVLRHEGEIEDRTL